MSKLTKEEQVIKTIENSDEQIKVLIEEIAEYKRSLEGFKRCIADFENKLNYKIKIYSP